MQKDKQKTPSPLYTFVTAIHELDKTAYDSPLDEENPLIGMAQEIALDPDMQPEESTTLRKLHRRERTFARAVIAEAVARTKAEVGEDIALESELLEGFRRGLGQIGLIADTVEGLTKGDKKELLGRESTESSLEDYVPTVLGGHRATIEAIEQTSGKWSLKDTRLVANGFLDTYLPVQSQLDAKKLRGEQKLDGIATVNAFSHAFVERLAAFPDAIQATSAISDVEEKVVEELKLRANPVQLRVLDRTLNEGGIGAVSEIQTLRRRVLAGVQAEFLVYNALKKQKAQLNGAEVSFSSVEQDVKEGWDFSLTSPTGDVYRIDTKLSGAYADLLNKQGRTVQALPEAPNVLIKQGKAGPVIVLAADRIAGIRTERNRSTVTDTEGLLKGVLQGMDAIDKLANQ